jgi:transcriptional regulator with XRE-family HTH domain
MPRQTPKNAIGPIVRKLRNQKGWTQEELAAKLQLRGWDCTWSWLAKIEAQQVAVKDFELLYFRAVFNKALEDFYHTLAPEQVDPRQNAAAKPATSRSGKRS